MPAATGKIWTAGLRTGDPVWLLEWEIRVRLPRRVLLAVDTSDSCANERDALKTLFSALSNAMEPGDRCALWIVGRREKAREVGISRHEDRQMMSQALNQALAAVRGGTWLAETLDGMLAETAGADPAESESFFLLASDGEIFDAEAIPGLGLPRLGFARLGDRSSRQLEIIEANSVAVAASIPALEKFLESRPLGVSLEHDWRGERLAEFTGEGEIAGDASPASPLLIQPGQNRIRLAFVGGEQPRPRLVYSSGGLSGRAWREESTKPRELSADAPAYLRRVLRSLDGNQVNWDRERLKLLAATETRKEEFSCLRCHPPKRLLARKSLFCSCGAFLLARDVMMRDEVLALHDGTICFLVSGDGEVAGEPVSRDHGAGNDAYGVYSEVGSEDARRWLVLDLYKI